MTERLSIPTLDDLATDPARALELPADVAIAALARLSVLQSNLLVAATRSSTTPAVDLGDVEVDAREAARRLGIAVPTFYKRLDEFPFVRREGRKVLASIRGIDRWRRERTGAR